MPASLLPKAIYHRLTGITPDDLRVRGIRLLMLDFDNTMLPYTAAEPTQELLCWLEELRQAGIMLCVVSNSKKTKSPDFCKKYQLGCITHSKKPFGRGIKKALALYKIPPSQAALAGDQIYTDVLGANGAGVYSILVTPLHLHNIWLKLRHVAELPFIYMARKRRIHHEES